MNLVQEFASIGVDIQLREKEAIALFEQYKAEAVAAETALKDQALTALAEIQAELAKFTNHEG